MAVKNSEKIPFPVLCFYLWFMFTFLFQVELVNLVKKYLDPNYKAGKITKDNYKDIVGKCVQKVLGTEVEAIVRKDRVKVLVQNYVSFYKHKKPPAEAEKHV